MSLRVYVQRDNFHTYEFSDESEYDCFRLTFRESDTYTLWLCEKGDGFGAGVLEIFSA